MTIRIAILHNSLNILGGGERFCLKTIEAFKEQGWEVILATVEPTNWETLKNVWGEIPKVDKEKPFLRIPIKRFAIYLRILSNLQLPILRRESDILFNTHGDVLVSSTDITYMHFPTFTLWNESYSKYKSGFWRIYFTPYYYIQKTVAKRHVNTLLLTNSRFSRSVIRRYLGRNALVIYPPVNVNRYLALNNEKRGNLVITIGRFSYEKKYENIVRIAEKLPDIDFHIIGSVASDLSYKYYVKIKKMIEYRNIKNIYLHPNLPQKKMENLLSSGKVYLHTMINEHFGISVVEGMASGLIPVVHRSGGPWTDIVYFGKYGFGYNTVEEAAHFIKKAIKEYDSLVKRIRERSKVFSDQVYKKNIVTLVNTYYIKIKERDRY